MIPGVSFCFAGKFLLLPQLCACDLGSGEKTVHMKTHISKLCTVRARCVQLPLCVLFVLFVLFMFFLGSD